MQLANKGQGLPSKVSHCYFVDVCGYFALFSEWHWLVSDLPGVKHRLCCRSEGSGLWMWLDVMWGVTCRLVFFHFPVASHLRLPLNLLLACDQYGTRVRASLHACFHGFLCFTIHHRILAALVYYFRLCHLSEYLIQRVIISCMYLIYIRYSCIVLLYVIFSWNQDQVLGETFHLFKFFGCEQQPAPSACGCGRPVRRDVTGQCPLERRSFVVLDCSYNENGSSTNLPGTTNANLGSKVGASVAGRNVQKNKEQEQSYNNETQNGYHFKFT